ncbi:TPA: helix-turn-helix domain-containing protein, partial [Streptococcus suis]
GISRQKYARIENGINSVTLEILVKLANVFDVTVKDITKVLEQEGSVAYRSGEQKQSTRDMLYMIDLFYANKRLYEKLTYQDKE